MKNDLTQEYLKSRLIYNPKTGIFTWKPRKIICKNDKTWNSKYSGKATGYTRHNRHKVIHLNNKEYQCSRLAWLYVNGVWPTHEIDHINCDPLDNRILNLREATRSENAINKHLQANNTSGYKGVWKRQHLNRWEAEICKNGKRIKLGGFPSPEEAYEAYKAAAIELHGEFAKL